MFAAEWRWQGVWHSFPFLHGTWPCNQGHRFEFSTNLYALEHVHVVQIWIMHLNASETQLMHKNVQTNPENPKNWHNTHVVLCWHEKIFEINKRQWILFRPKGGTFHIETIRFVVRSSCFWESYAQTCPKWDKKFTTTCWCRSMIACQVSWISDEFWIY